MRKQLGNVHLHRVASGCMLFITSVNLRSKNRKSVIFFHFANNLVADYPRMLHSICFTSLNALNGVKLQVTPGGKLPAYCKMLKLQFAAAPCSNTQDSLIFMHASETLHL